jgi:hypothetical protein
MEAGASGNEFLLVSDEQEFRVTMVIAAVKMSSLDITAVLNKYLGLNKDAAELIKSNTRIMVFLYAVIYSLIISFYDILRNALTFAL